MGKRNLIALERYSRDVGWDRSHDGLTDVYLLILRHVGYRTLDNGNLITISTPDLCIELMGLSRHTVQRALRRIAGLGLIEYQGQPGSKYFEVRFRRSLLERGDPIELPNKLTTAEVIQYPK